MEVRLLEGLLAPPALALFGLCIGSFLNVVIHRLPKTFDREWWDFALQQLRDREVIRRVFPVSADVVLSDLDRHGAVMQAELQGSARLTLSRPRSHCPACGHVLAWHENVPLLGWLRLKGRCGACRSPISMRYPVVELLTGSLFALVGLRFGPTATTLVYCAAAALLITSAMVDLDTKWLPDEFTLPLIALGIFGAWLQWTPLALADATLGALFGWLSLWFLTRLYKLVRGVEGMASGDFRLLAGLGAVLGWKLLPSIVLLSSAVGAVVGIAMITSGRGQWTKQIPFGPYLAGGGLAAMFFGEPLTRLYFPSL